MRRASNVATVKVTMYIPYDRSPPPELNKDAIRSVLQGGVNNFYKMHHMKYGHVGGESSMSIIEGLPTVESLQDQACRVLAALGPSKKHLKTIEEAL